MSLLHVFDMDGTLLRGTSASVEIARELDRLPDVLALEEAFGAGTMTTYEFAVAACQVYEGLTDATVAQVFGGCSWLTGIAEVMADIDGRGEHSAVITMSPGFFADLLRGMGVHEVHASRFPPLPLREPPARTAILTPADKVRIVDGMLARRGLDRSRCVAYGDSASDLPLFRHVDHTVAVNATEELRRIAQVHVEGDDLYAAYRAARARIEPLDRSNGSAVAT